MEQVLRQWVFTFFSLEQVGFLFTMSLTPRILTQNNTVWCKDQNNDHLLKFNHLEGQKITVKHDVTKIKKNFNRLFVGVFIQS